MLMRDQILAIFFCHDLKTGNDLEEARSGWVLLQLSLDHRPVTLQAMHILIYSVLKAINTMKTEMNVSKGEENDKKEDDEDARRPVENPVMTTIKERRFWMWTTLLFSISTLYW